MSKRGRSRSRSSARSRSYSMAGTPYQQNGSGISVGIGHYAGKLRQPKRAKKPSKYDKAGYSKEIERWGTQSLTNVCYVGATSFCHEDLGPVVGVAFIRKVMKRHYQYEYTHPDQVVSPRVAGNVDLNVAGSGPVRIIYYYEEVLGNNAEPYIAAGHTFDFYDPATGVTSLRSLAQAGQDFYQNVLQGQNFGQLQQTTEAPIRRFHGYSFVEVDYTVNTVDPNGQCVGRASTLFPVKNQYLTCYSAVRFGIQNVTAADTEGSKLTTRVDANPIKGKLMKFKDLLPRLEQRRGAYGNLYTADNSYKLQIDVNGDGIIKPDLSLAADWTQIPTASMFSNCSGELSVNLEPGSIKDYSFVFKFNGTLEKFMRGFSGKQGWSTYPWSLQKEKLFGTSILFMLEKRMPTGASAVEINFHYEANVGCVFGKRLGALMQRGTDTATAATEAP